MNIYHYFLVVLVLILSSIGQAGEQYKWVDEEGNIVYSQRNPGGTYKLEKTIQYENEWQSDIDAMKRENTRKQIEAENARQEAQQRMIFEQEWQQRQNELETARHNQAVEAQLKETNNKIDQTNKELNRARKQEAIQRQLDRDQARLRRSRGMNCRPNYSGGFDCENR